MLKHLVNKVDTVVFWDRDENYRYSVRLNTWLEKGEFYTFSKQGYEVQWFLRKEHFEISGNGRKKEGL